tara:strand:- start:1270 stop:1575 length:306 start_codon:yes stop_codon:yes gene_type:complete
MKKFLLFLPVLFLIIATTLTKNSTKKLDRKIFETKENIRVLENRFELVLLDYNFLTSPKKLMEYQSTFFENNLIQLNINKLNKLKTLEDITLNNSLKINNE